MKKYSDYMNSISSIELYDNLIEYGFFAEKIPSFLTSQNFLAFLKNSNVLPDEKSKDYIRYSNIRNINIPRVLSIPEPFAYANQCKSLSDNWDEIKNHFEKKTINDDFKISRIHIRKLKNKEGLFEMTYKNFSKDGEPEQDIMIGARYVINADISTCFPSIYSHSIAWALVGKTSAKVNTKKGEWFNQIDFYTRNLKFGETNGVLIGCHSSNIISEIVLTAIDCELSKKGFRYTRNIDDYTCYVKSNEDAEQFLLILSEELKKYELSLNHKKTKVNLLPQSSDSNWVTKLNHFTFIDTYKKDDKEFIKVKEIKGFINYAIELMIDNQLDASILKYAIKVISSKYLSENARKYYVKYIHHLILLYPYLISSIDESVFGKHENDSESIKLIAEDVYKYGLDRKIYEACSYSIYWALKYDFQLENFDIKENSIKSLDCIFMMLGFLHDKKYNPKKYLKEYKDKAKMIKNNDFDRYWLFIYETLSTNELTANYKQMKLKKISFIKAEFNIDFVKKKANSVTA